MKKIGEWIVKVIWPVFEPIIRWGLRLSIISGLIWLTFYAEFADSLRKAVVAGLSTVSNDVGRQIDRMMPDTEKQTGSTPRTARNLNSPSGSAYESLRCRKERMRVAEGEKLIAKYEKKNKNLAASAITASIISAARGEKEKAGNILQRGGQITKSEGYELEKARLAVKRIKIDSLECFEG